MKKLKMLWMPVLLGALLMATLVEVAGARPNARPEASPALVDYMFCGYNCAHWNAGTSTAGNVATQVSCTAGTCAFACPVKPPHEGLIRVQRLAMYAYDNDGAPPPSAVGIALFHAYPKTGTVAGRLGASLGAPTADNVADSAVYAYNPANFKVAVAEWTTDNAADPAVYVYNPANFKVSVLQDIFVWTLVPSAGQKLYGFKVKYEPL